MKRLDLGKSYLAWALQYYCFHFNFVCGNNEKCIILSCHSTSQIVWKHFFPIKENYPANVYLLKVNNRNTIKKCEIYSKLTIKTLERRQ